jgi:transposase
MLAWLSMARAKQTGYSVSAKIREACGGAHHLSRLLRDNGFEVRLMSSECVRP